MICRTDITNLKTDIGDKIGQKIIVKGSLGRSKAFEKEATIEKAYPNIFVVKYAENDRNVTYKGNGRYEVKFTDMSNFPITFDMNTSMNNKLATIIENIEASNEKQGTQVDIGTYRGYKVHINKGTQGSIWVTSPKGHVASYETVAQVVALLTQKEPQINAR